MRARVYQEVSLARIQLTINGRPRTLEIDPRESLLDVLRERLELTGAENLLGA